MVKIRNQSVFNHTETIEIEKSVWKMLRVQRFQLKLSFLGQNSRRKSSNKLVDQLWLCSIVYNHIKFVEH